MAHITKKPSGLRSGNDLDDISDDLLAPFPQMLRLSGRDLFIIDVPLQAGDWIKCEFTMEAGDLLVKAPDKDGAKTHDVRLLKYVTAKLSVAPYKPAMMDRDGKSTLDNEPADSDDAFGPDFSHNGQGE